MSDQPSRLAAALEGRYRIERAIGSGGMATVYLAHDVRHDRKVALKVLRPELAAVMGAERFLSEIRTTANLQHPHILQLYDSGEADGFLYFVMPFVEGETLRDRIDREKQLPVDEAVALARQIAAALQAAHDRGVVHRDIKPANILLSHGEPLVADFGIALAVQEAGGGRLTETGLSLGTPFYMSPEQATADRAPDARSDVYSLGSVLYEMLTGEPPFTGNTAQAVLGKILSAAPVQPTQLRKSIPAHVEGVILRSLERLPADRFPSAAEFGRALGDPSFRHGAAKDASIDSAAAGAAIASLRLRLRAAIAAAAVLGLGFVWALLGRNGAAPAATNVVEFFVAGDSTSRIVGGAPGSLALTRDGGQLAFVGASGPEGGLHQQAYVRRLDERVARPVPETDDARSVFFSPDGSWLGFSTGANRLFKVRLAGGSPVPITDLAGPLNSASWGEDDRIVYGVTGAPGLMSVAASGGQGEEILAQNDTVTGMLDPRHLPGGRVVVFSSLINGNKIQTLDLETREVRTLGPGISPYWVPDHLVYGLPDGTVLAHPFDARRLELTGEPVQIASGVGGWLNISRDLAVSESGTIAYIERGLAGSDLLLLNSGGPRVFESLLHGTEMSTPRVAPNGEAVLYTQGIPGAAPSSLFVYSERQRTSRLLYTGQGVWGMGWSPDGGTVLLAQGQPGSVHFFTMPSDGSRAPTLAVRRRNPVGNQMAEYSPDGAWIVWTEGGTATSEIWAVRSGGTGEPTAVVSNGGYSSQPTASPDSRWLAYTSEVTGAAQVYVTRFPEGGLAVPISNAGGMAPSWGTTRDTLTYFDGANLTRALLSFDDAPVVESRELVSAWPFDETSRRPRQYDRHPRGLVVIGSSTAGTRIVVRTSWRPSGS
jgi:WD40 repeat protein